MHGISSCVTDPCCYCGGGAQARIYDLLNDPENAITFYKKVLVLDASNIESIACLGAHFFYAEQPEISIRYYRRWVGICSTLT